MLWVDKYRPKELSSMELHRPVCERLVSITAKGDFPHLLFYGPSGGGKKTRVTGLLRHFYGPGVEKVRPEYKSIKVSDSKSVDVTTLSSAHHMELNPSEVGIYDRAVVMTMLKEIAESMPLTATKDKAVKFKVVVLNEVDDMTKGAQQALRRTMEKYMGTCRLILVASSISRIIEPLRSRCLGIRVPLPTHQEVCQVLQSVAKREQIKLPDEFAMRIAEASERNLRRAVLMLEASKARHYPFSDNEQPMLSDWERCIEHIADGICTEQSPKKILETRGQLYEMLANCIPPEVILKALSARLIDKVDTALKCEIAKWAAHYDHNLKLGSKPIFHLEAFVVKFMFLYKSSLSRM